MVVGAAIVVVDALIDVVVVGVMVVGAAVVGAGVGAAVFTGAVVVVVVVVVVVLVDDVVVVVSSGTGSSAWATGAAITPIVETNATTIASERTAQRHDALRGRDRFRRGADAADCVMAMVVSARTLTRSSAFSRH